MRDRVSTKILENGATRYGVYDEDGNLLRYEYIKLEDEPDEEGTLLNKANLLTDEVARQMGLRMAVPTPNDMFSVLANVGNVHVWSKAQLKDTFVPVLGAAEALVFSYTTGGWLDNTVGLFYGNVDASSGEIILLNEQAPADIPDIVGLYYNKGGVVYFVSEVTGWSSGTNGTTVNFTGKKVSVGPAKAGDPAGFVTSADSTAYPQNGDVGDFRYIYLGQLGDKMRIEVGSYVGTGTYGTANKNKLTFPARPKFVLIFYGSVPPDVDLYNHSFVGVYISGSGYMWNLAGSTYRSSNTVPESLAVSASGNSIEWHSTYSQYGQLNSSGYTYNYIYGC